MNSDARRQGISDLLLERARADQRVVGAARTGSAANGTQDQWSDIDLLFGVAEAESPADVLADWSRWVYVELAAAHHFDLLAGAAIYRAFLLVDGLEVDLGFTPLNEFGPVGEGAFDVVFGQPVARRSRQPDTGQLIGLGWHHALRARAAIARDRLWQAEYWINGLRDHTVSLACLRHGLPAQYAKGAHLLPAADLQALKPALVEELTANHLAQALGAVVQAFLAELQRSDPTTHARLRPALGHLVDELR